MIDREKVIKGLECRLDINGSKYKHCLTCDYRHDIDHCQWACQTDGILEDALALLKAQEPRVIVATKYCKKIESQNMDCFIWIEEREREDVYLGIVNFVPHLNGGADICRFTRFMGNSKEGIKFEDYGKTWRCWTSRPTDELRKATPW